MWLARLFNRLFKKHKKKTYRPLEQPQSSKKELMSVLIMQINQRSDELETQPELVRILTDKKILNMIASTISRSRALQDEISNNIFVENFCYHYKKIKKYTKNESSFKITKYTLKKMIQPKLNVNYT